MHLKTLSKRQKQHLHKLNIKKASVIKFRRFLLTIFTNIYAEGLKKLF